MDDILKPAMIVLDPFWVTKRSGVTMRLKDVTEDEATHMKIRFFF